MPAQRILILGLGNPILGDDGVGWKVVERVRKKLIVNGFDSAQLEIDCLAVGGLTLMERMVGYDRAILVDAITTGLQPVGTVVCLTLSELPNRALGHLSSSHDTTLQNALEMGRRMGVNLPNEIKIVGVETQPVFDFSEDLSPNVGNAVPEAAAKVFDLVSTSSLDKALDKASV